VNGKEAGWNNVHIKKIEYIIKSQTKRAKRVDKISGIRWSRWWTGPEYNGNEMGLERAGNKEN
jgi:hypothetical protein